MITLLVNSFELETLQCVVSYEKTDAIFLSAVLPLDLDYNEVHSVLLETHNPDLKIKYDNGHIETYQGFYFSTLTLNHEADERTEMVCTFRKDLV